MKAFARIIQLCLLWGAVLLSAGCASYTTMAGPGHGFTGVQRCFVVSNLNDNHALDRRIAEALKAHGLEADVGPLTMMPEETQAVITYQDHWTWDFGDHLVYLLINAHVAHRNESIATVTFTASIPLREPLPDTVGRLVGRLLAQKKS